MKIIEYKSILSEYNINELSSEQYKLIKLAKKSSLKAYAPYSNFFVGAAIKLSNGKMVTGNNQENSAFPSGLCAERVALFYAGANYPNEKIEKIAIFAKASFNFNQIIMPCGNCRQALIEYEHKQNQNIELILNDQKNNILISKSIANILPFAFKCDELKKI
tara:strand:- start:607 stop:1092 length:486 start_codon:yes stop_codon:yes gene_type:complete